MLRSCQERRILAFASLRADLSVADIATQTGTRPSKVRSVLNASREEEVFSLWMRINYRVLGFERYFVYCSLDADGMVRLDALCDLLVDHAAVEWASTVSGEYQLVFTVFVRNDGELSELFEQITDRVGPVFSRTACLRTVVWNSYGANFLSPEVQQKQGWVEITSANQQTAIDAFDIRLLDQMCTDPWGSAGQFAQALSVPKPTVLYRMKRLYSLGVVSNTELIFDYRKVGITYTTDLMKFSYVTTKDYQQLESFCRLHPNISHLGRLQGEWDFSLGIGGADAYEMEGVRRELIARFGKHIRQMTILQRCRTAKKTPRPGGYLEGMFCKEQAPAANGRLTR